MPETSSPSKERWISFRVTQAELDLIESNAAALGLQKSEYLRALANMPLETSAAGDDDAGPSRFVYVDAQTARDMLKQLRAMAKLYGDAVTALNEIKSRRILDQDEMFDLLSRAVTSVGIVENMRAEVLSLCDDLLSAERFDVRRRRVVS